MKKNYIKYLDGEHWQEVKEKCLLSDSKCRICGRVEGLILHHKTYDNMWQETEKDFIILCQRCHRKIHFKGKIKLSNAGVMEKYQKLYAHKKRSEIDWERKELANKSKFSCIKRYSKGIYY